MSGTGGGYFSNQELFMQPEVNQHNSHMVMTGVHKPRKSKRLNVDTRFCDDYNVNTDSVNPAAPQPVANFNMTLPERVNEIRSMRVTHLEVPMTFYNVSSTLGNNSFVLTNSTPASATITVPNGQYTAPTLIAAINTAIAAASGFTGVSFSTGSSAPFFCSITNASASPVTVTFGTLPQGKSMPCSERYPLTTPVQSLVPTGVALNDSTAANPNTNRQNITMKPPDFYTSSQRTQRQAAAAQCLKSASTPGRTPASALTTAVNTSSSNPNLFQNIQDMDVLPFRLGWLLGFRATTLARLSVTVAASGGSVASPAMMDVNGPRYLYLVVDEFLNGNPHTFTTMLKTSQIKNNVLGRVAVNMAAATGAPFGTILTANLSNGLLVSDTRTYLNKVNLQRLNVQLVNEMGVPMNLNGLDFSFCLEMETE